MMPGEKQAEAGGVASEAFSGTCENCSVLTRSLDEYMAALVTLKQKIIDTDHLLSEYKEKCDELQKSQRESSRLHKQLDDVLLKLGPLEKQTMDFEAIKAELEEAKATLTSYQQKCEELDGLREQNSNTLALNKKLEDDLRMAEDVAKSQSLEYTKLSSEKKTIEEDLQKTQDSLRMCQQAAEEVESLRLQNAKTLILKSNLENQLLALEDTRCKQNNEISALKTENNMLQENLRNMQMNVEKLESELNKEKKNASTQTMLEPQVDKAKVKKLLEELWHCMEPLSQSADTLDLNETTDNQRASTPLKVKLLRSCQPLPVSPCKKQTLQSAPSTPAKEMKSPVLRTNSCSVLKVSPRKSKSESSSQEEKSPGKGQRNKKTGRKKKKDQGSEELDHGVTRIIKGSDDGSNDHSSDRDCWRSITDLWDILDCFRPLPAALSPMPLSNETAEMDDDSSVSGLKESSLSNDEDSKQSTKCTEPDPPDDSMCSVSDKREVTPSGSFLKSNLSNTEISLFPQDAAKEVLDSCVYESQDMEVEESSEVQENLPCVVSASHLHNGHNRKPFTVKPDRITVTAESQLSTMKSHFSVHSQSVDSGLPNALCDEETSKGSDLIKAAHKCLDTDDAPVECLPGEKANVTEESSEIPLNPDTEIPLNPDTEIPLNPDTGTPLNPDTGTVLERTLEEIQKSLTPLATTEEGDSKSYENLNSVDRQEHNSSSPQINGDSFVGLSKHEELSDDEFFGLKRKVRGIFSKPGAKDSPENLNGDASCMPQSDGKQKPDTFQKTNSETEGESDLEGPKTESDPGNEKDGSSLGDNSAEQTCEPHMHKDRDHQTPSQKNKDEPVTLPQESLQIIDAKEENTSSEAHDAKAEVSSVNPQDVCSVLPNPAKLSDMKTEANVSPLTAFVSRDALQSTPSPESIGRVRTEMGPPLPPAVMPLTATPPKFGKHHTLASPSMKLPVWLPSEGPLSQDQQQAVSSLDSDLQDEAKRSLCLTTPSPSNGVPSSPLQFGSATPKHAVPVPGRLPSSALNSSSPTTSQENSMQMLDTMYPELSAQARTLNILRGNVTLGRAGSGESGASPPSVNQISGNKTINSSSTAFTKTEQKAKRAGVNMLLPKSAKKLRLDACSPVPIRTTSPGAVNNKQPADAMELSKFHPTKSPSDSSQEQGTTSKPETHQNDKEVQVSDAIEKLQKSCFDLLPVIKSHVFLGRISKVPVLRDEEKSVIADFCSNQSSAEEFMSAILNKMKVQRGVLKQELLQSICRVYVGLCRQRGDVRRAHALAYSVLKENFIQAPKIILFMVTTWPDMLSCGNSLCKAIHTVSKLRADKEILDCLTLYLHWDKASPDDIHEMISSTIKALLEDGNLTFQKHERNGDDLCPAAWEYIFTLDLLCAQLGWKWTHDNIIGKELWPVMNTWVSQPRLQQTPIRDVSVAVVLRLIGRLSQLGIKEKLCKSVQNVAKAMNLFAKHGITEGVPWEVQLSAVYTVYDLSPVNPKEALDALASWREETTQAVPSGVTSCIMQIGSLCRQIKS